MKEKFSKKGHFKDFKKIKIDEDENLTGNEIFKKHSRRELSLCFVKNKKKEDQSLITRDEIEEATKNNLEQLGFTFSENIDQLLMRYEEEGWDRNKNSRIQRIAENYRIVMIIGDNLGDFVGAEENNLSVIERNDIFKKYDSHWGNFWFMLPNPVYGDWEGALIDFNYNLSQQDELSKKFQSLDEK